MLHYVDIELYDIALFNVTLLMLHCVKVALSDVPLFDVALFDAALMHYMMLPFSISNVPLFYIVSCCCNSCSFTT